MCLPCLRTPVHHVSGLYTLEAKPRGNFRPETLSRRLTAHRGGKAASTFTRRVGLDPAHLQFPCDGEQVLNKLPILFCPRIRIRCTKYR